MINSRTIQYLGRKISSNHLPPSIGRDTSPKPTGAAGGYSDLFPERAIRELVSLLRNSLWWKLTADAAWLGGMVLMVSQYYTTVAGGFKYVVYFHPCSGKMNPI